MTTRLEALAQLTAKGEPFEVGVVPGPRGDVRAFVNAPPTLRDLYEQTRSDKTFIQFQDESLTFEEAWRAACALARALVVDFGVGVGDRVAISMRNYPEWMLAFNAVTSVGAIAVAMNAMWQSHEMAQGLATCGARVLICDEERLERLMMAAGGGEAPGVKLALERGDEGLAVIAARVSRPDLPDGVHRWEAVVAAHGGVEEMPPAPAGVGPDTDAIMLFTSGSTGAPKGAVSSHRAVISALLSWELDANAAWETGLLPRPPEDPPQAVTLLAIPLFHVTGLHTIYLSCFRAQRRLISMYKWDAALGARIVEAEKVTSFVAPPAITGDLVLQGLAGGHDLSSLVQVGGGGAARAPEQVRAIPVAFPNARPGTGWGMTETNAIGVGIAADDYLTHPESSGRVSAVLDIRIADPVTGKALGVGQRGELQVRGVSMFRCYWGRPEATAESFVASDDGGDDWYHTGDVAYVDADGFCYIVDRIKDLVIRGGENVGCGAVEAALLEHPGVVEACVYGVPDARLGEEVAATVYGEPGLDVEGLRAFAAERLSRFEVPRYIEVAGEPLPRGDTGKIFKRQLRAEHAARLAE